MRLPWDNQGGGQQGWGGLLGSDAAPIWLSLASGLLSPGNDLGAGVGQGLQQAAPYMQNIAARRKAIEAARAMSANGQLSPEQNMFLQQYPDMVPQVLGKKLFPPPPEPITPYQQEALKLDKQKMTLDEQRTAADIAYRKQQEEHAARQGRFQQGPDGAWYDMTGDKPVAVTDPMAAKPKPATDTELKTAGYADRMNEAETALQDVMKVDPATGKASPGGMVPNDFQTAAVNALGGTDSVLHGKEYQRYLSAARVWVSGLLRKDSQGQISQSEFDDAFKTYFPQYGDHNEVILAKQKMREQAIMRMQAESGAGGAQLQSRLGPARGAPQAAPSRDDLIKKYGLR